MVKFTIHPAFQPYEIELNRTPACDIMARS